MKPEELEMVESIQNVLTRRRPSRVKITYEVETGGALQRREIPFVGGIFSELSGDAPGITKPELKAR